MLTIDEILNMKDRKLAYYELVGFFEQAPESVRKLIRDTWDMDEEWIYPNIETLALNLPDEPSCEHRIFASVMYNAIDEFRVGYRESLVGMAIDYHSALAAGLDPRIIFERVAKCASDYVAQELLNFLARTDEERSLKAFGLVKVPTEAGCKIIMNW